MNDATTAIGKARIGMKRRTEVEKEYDNDHADYDRLLRSGRASRVLIDA